MSKTCEKCGYENVARPHASACSKCATPYVAGARRRAVQPGPAVLQPAGGGAPAVASAGVSPLRAGIGVVVLLGLIAAGLAALGGRSGSGDTLSAQAQRERADRVEKAIAEAKVTIGMTADEVRRAWGEPTSINETIRAGLNSQQWVYRRSGWTNAQFVYLDNGVVRSIQTVQ